MLGLITIMETFSTGKSYIQIHIPEQQIEFRTSSAGSVTRFGRSSVAQNLSWLGSWHSASVGWTSTSSFASPAGMPILCNAIGARNSAQCLGLTKHCSVFLYRSLRLVMPRKLNTLDILFSDLGAWFQIVMYRIPYCGMRTGFFGHCGPIQGQLHVGLFLLYPISLPSHTCRHV